MYSRFRNISVGILVICIAATCAKPAAIDVNGTCEVGNCSSVDSLSLGQSIGLSPFNFNYVAGADTYNLSGSYAASYTASGTFIAVFISAIYTGSSPSTGNDTLTFNMLQNYFNSGPGTWDGTYTEHVPLVIGGQVGPSSSVTGNLFYDGQGVGQVGPFIGSGSYNADQSANLTGLDGDTLAADFQFVFDFTPGTQPGAGATVAFSSTVPEPAQTIPAALALSALLGIGLMRLRSRTSKKRCMDTPTVLIS
jgi:hypothetical protein